MPRLLVAHASNTARGEERDATVTHTSIRLPVLEELHCAIEGRSLADHSKRVDHGLEAIFITA